MERLATAAVLLVGLGPLLVVAFWLWLHVALCAPLPIDHPCRWCH